MNYVSNKKLRIFSSLIFFIGVLAVVLNFSVNHANKTQNYKGFVITSKQTFVPSDGSNNLLQATKVRYQKTDGAFKEIATYFQIDGNVETVDVTYGLPGQGVYKVNDKGKVMNFLSHKPLESPAVTAETIRRSPRFLKEELVMGYTTYVVREYFTGSTDYYSEAYISPDLQGMTLKRIFFDEDGTTIIEPISIVASEPASEEFTSLKGYSIDYRLFEEKIRSAERHGDRHLVDQLREEKSYQRQF